MPSDSMQRLPNCPFNIVVRSACRELPGEGSYRLISTDEDEDGMTTMVLELVEADA